MAQHIVSRRPSYRCTRNTGFTAVELLMVIAIIAILATLAMPSFRNTLLRYRVNRVAEDITATLYFARSEAIRRGGHITVRKASTVGGCDADLGQEWSCGWSVFLDANDNGTLNAIDGDFVLQAAQVPQGVTVMLFKGKSGGPVSMTADRWGRFSGLGAFSFALKPTDSDDVELTMEVCMASGGRMRVLKGAESCRP